MNNSIDKLKAVIIDEYCSKMNLSNIKGFLGELLVRKKLMEEGAEIEPVGNQAGYDLMYGNYKIDVKFSTFKNDMTRDPEKYWGWALVHENKKREISCTHFVCIAVDENYDPFCYYVIKQEDYQRFPKGQGQFKGVKHGYAVFPDNIFPNWRADKLEIFRKSLEIPEGVVIKVNPNESLIEAISY